MKTIPLTQGQVALVDDEDYERVNQFKWCANICKHTTYAQRQITTLGKVKTIKLHRFIMNVDDSKIEIDHKNGNGIDCQKSNLRTSTHLENLRNSTKRNGTHSIYKGVSKSRNKHRAYINNNGKAIHIGVFYNEKEAAIAYDKKAIELFGEFAKTNFK